MSFVSNTVFTSSSRLHGGNGGSGGSSGVKGASQGSGGLLTPLFQLVRDPYGTIVGTTNTQDAPDVEEEGDLEDRKQVLYLRMKDAESYEEWKAAASELDTLEGNDAWKFEDESLEYDAALVQARLEQLDEARTNCDVKRMLFLIRTSLSRGLGGMGDLRLYKHSHIGTKNLIDRYIESAVQTLVALPEVVAKQGDNCPVKDYFVYEELLRTRQSFGRTALLLSGGGTFGMNHIGVVKCLWEQRLLPRVISGASAGSIVCAILCSKTDEEMPAVLHDFCHGDLAVFEEAGKAETVIEKVARFMKHGSLYDISHLERVMKIMLGDTTFQESYNRTQRVLNITVSSASVYELPRLLNYATAPDVLIWSAVCASCSVPFVFNAASLMAKDRITGKAIPWDPITSEGWVDGSVDNDLPMNRLAEMFCVNHFIVSQVNPHVVPFLAKEEEALTAAVQQDVPVSTGPGWMHNLAAFAKGEALHRLDMLAEMGVFPNAVTKARSVLNQRYSGDITIFPTIHYTNFPKILTNPTTEYMLRSMRNGEQATWPKVSRVQNHVAVELALDKAINMMASRVVFSPNQVNLRLLNFTRSSAQNAEASRNRRLNKSEHFINLTAQHTPAEETAPPSFLRPRKSQPPIPPPSKAHLPAHGPSIATDFSKHSCSTADASSTDLDSSGDEDSYSNEDSNTSGILSSPSPPRSPPRGPELWPSARQLPSTPAKPSATRNHRRYYSSISARMMAAATPSSPELRYKRLFHPPPGTPPPEPRRSLQPLTEAPTAQETMSPLGLQKSPPPADMFGTDILDEHTIRAFNPPAFSPAMSPRMTRDAARSPAIRQRSPWQQIEGENEEQVGRENEMAQGLGLGLGFDDYSGTRGMVLRKQQSRSNGYGKETES